MPLKSCLQALGFSVPPFHTIPQYIVLACVVLLNMLRAERGAGGARDLDNEEIPCALEGGDDGDGHDRNPANTAKEQSD